jgi:hypothetical protein
MSLIAAWFWPTVSTRKTALFAINEGFGVAVVLTLYQLATAAVAASQERGVETAIGGLVVAACYAFAAIGMRKKSRVAAVLGLSAFVLSNIYSRASIVPVSLPIVMLVALALFHGIRGTFAFNQLAPLPAGTPSIKDSFLAVSAGSEQKTVQE